MLIIWKGLGILVLPILLTSALLCNFTFDSLFGHGFYETHKWTAGISLFVAAAVNWSLGAYLHNRPPRVVIDKQTGQEMALLKRHAFFWIPMDVWGLIFLVIGIGVFLMGFFK
jgi:hypothetical protein